MSIYQKDADMIVRASELGIIPKLLPSLTPKDILNIIEEVYTREQNSTIDLEEEKALISYIELLDSKGIMDEFYPSGYAVRRKKVFKGLYE